MTVAKPGPAILEELFATIEERRATGDPKTSHTASLFAQGPARIAQKVGEEAVELAIEAVRGEADKVRSESADLLYHLLVLWAAAGVRPEDVWRALAERRGRSGIEEKTGRVDD